MRSLAVKQNDIAPPECDRITSNSKVGGGLLVEKYASLQVDKVTTSDGRWFKTIAKRFATYALEFC